MFRNPTTDVILVVVVLLLFFGPKRLPILGRELGRGMREFKESITGENKHRDDEETPALTASSGQPPAIPAAQPVPAAQPAPPAPAVPPVAPQPAPPAGSEHTSAEPAAEPRP